MAKKKKKKVSDPIFDQYNKEKDLLFRQSGNYINSLRDEYGSLISDQGKANQRYEAGVDVSGIVSGRNRYASEVQGSIKQGAVNEGIAKIQKLVNAKNAAIQAAIDARDSKSFELLDNAMKNKAAAEKEIREAAQQELENTIKLNKEDRDAKTFARTEAEAEAENLAPSVLSILTGNEEEDFNTIKEVARLRGMDANILLKGIDSYKALQEERKYKNLPTMAREYEYAKQNGYYNGSFLDYQKLRSSLSKGAPKSKVLDLKTANRLGLVGLEGYAEDEIIYDLLDDTPPMWFIQKEFPLYSPIPSVARAAWDKFRNQSDISDWTKGINKSNTSWLSLLNSSNYSDQLPDDTLEE